MCVFNYYIYLLTDTTYNLRKSKDLQYTRLIKEILKVIVVSWVIAFLWRLLIKLKYWFFVVFCIEMNKLYKSLL